MASSRRDFAVRLFSGLPARYDLLEELFSFGQNRRWRKAMVERLLVGRPGLILDVATGTAGVGLALTDRGSARVVGLDLTEAMLREGQVRVAAAGRGGTIQLILGRAEQLPFADETFDALAFTYLLRYVEDPAATLCELARVVKPGGVVASVEFFVPPRTIWRALWWLYTRVLLPAGGILAGPAWYRVGRFLGPSISNHYRRYPLESLVAAWAGAGFDDVHCQAMSLGGGLVMHGRKRAV